MSNINPLTQLRDIHVPSSIPWSWYGLVAFIIIAALLITWFIIDRRRKTLFRRQALQQLITIEQQFAQEANIQQLLIECNQLLRRVCLTLYPTEQVASLTGQAWLAFLDQHTKKKNAVFNEEIKQALIYAMYQPSPLTLDSDALIHSVHTWIREK